MQRIAETGLKLFVMNGYEHTTLDDIAAEAGIARRTFFYYFKSKEDILLEYINGGGFAKALRAALLAQPTDQTPLSAMFQSILALMSAHETDVAVAVDRLLLSTDALKARMQASYVETERIACEALCERWPNEKPASLRLTAMVALGALRVAKEAWRQEGGKEPLAKYLRESFADLEAIM